MNKKIKALLLIDFILIVLSIVFTCISLAINDKFSYAAGFIVGVTIVAIICTIIMIIYNCKNIKSEYDERQIIARGKAFQVAFFTLMVSLLLDGFIRTILEYDWSDYFTGVAICIGIAIGVFVTVSIYKDAYVQLEKNIFNMAIIMLLIGVLNISIGVLNIIEYGFVLNGQITASFLNLFYGVEFVIIGILCLVKNHMNKKEELEE